MTKRCLQNFYDKMISKKITFTISMEKVTYLGGSKRELIAHENTKFVKL